MAKRLPFILSIPHGGQTVPPEIAEYCALTEREVFEESDAFTKDIYGMSDAVLGEVTQDVARVIIDLNRPPGDLPPLLHDGAIKSKTSYGKFVWTPPGAVDGTDFQAELLERYYHPYHGRLEKLLKRHRREVRLLIDCHSMSPEGPTMAKDAGLQRPMICLSNLGNHIGMPRKRGERTSAPSHIILKLRHIMEDVFARDISELSDADPLSLNEPFQGGYITQHYSLKGLWVIQVELSRSLYVHPKWFDEETRTADDGRLKDLNTKLRTSFAELAAFLEAT